MIVTNVSVKQENTMPNFKKELYKICFERFTWKRKQIKSKLTKSILDTHQIVVSDLVFFLKYFKFFKIFSFLLK